MTLFDLPTANPKHPAKYTTTLFSAFVQMIKGCNRIIDPFGGTGKVFLLNRWYPDMDIYAIEIEREWARMSKAITGNALYLPFADCAFDGICTSPTYGNRLSDYTLPYSKGGRFSYVDSIGRRLHSDNSGNWQWGEKYRNFHLQVWSEAARVLRERGVFVLNIKDHIRDGQVRPVTEWHIGTILSLGFEIVDHVKINTPSIRYGKNYDKRIEYESVIKFIRGARDSTDGRACAD